MKKRILVAFALSAFLLWTANAFELVKNGEVQAVVVTPPGNDPELNEAVAFFLEEAEKCVGKKFRTVPGKTAGQNSILLDVRKTSLPLDDAFTLDFPDRHTLRIHCSPRSARWAFNFLLEEYFGVRWLFARSPHDYYGGEINHYPQVKNLILPERKIEKNSSFNLYRVADYRFCGFEKTWNLKRSFMGSHCMMADVFPVYKYAVDQSWPREILPMLNGKKFLPPKAKAPLSDNIWQALQGYNQFWQVCWSHPKTREIAIENILEILAKNPDRHEINMDVNALLSGKSFQTCLLKSGLALH